MYRSTRIEQPIVNITAANGSSDPPNDELVSDGEESNDSLGAPGSPSITSRLSVLKFCAVVAKFDKFKRDLVEETGFSGMLDTKSWQKINLKLSAWLMDRVDAEASTLNIEGQPQIDLYDQEVQKVFCLSCGKKTIGAEGFDPPEACIEYTRIAATISDKGTHSLKAAESILLKDISVESTKIEIDCFKIVFVIYVAGHILAPSAKHDYITIDFWPALNDPSALKEWNWCGYVMKHLCIAVRKFKSDVARRNPTIHLVGNYLFLQVCYFDKLDLGPLSPAPGVFPRAGLFDYETIKKMIETVTMNDGTDVSFHGANVRSELSSHNGANNIAAQGPSAYLEQRKTPVVRTGTPCSSMMRSSYARTGALEFTNYIRTRYPSIAGEKLGILLKEHNARGLANFTEIHQRHQANMFTFVDKIMGCIAETCTCCKAAGNSTPSRHIVSCAPSLAAKIISYLDDIAGALVVYYVDMPKKDGTVMFGETTVSQNIPIDIATDCWARDPWSVGSCPPCPPPTVTVAIQDWFTRASIFSLERKWIIHPRPRLAILEGTDILNQLALSKPLGHEMFAIMMRGWGQIDDTNNKDSRRMRWRKFMEPDFATVVLSNVDPMEIMGIHVQFLDDISSFEVGGCRMWYIPVVLADGWVVYQFDMLRRRIYVLDPSIGPFGFSSDRVKIHEYVSGKLHGALFHCIQTFFKNWSCNNSEWKRSFPIIMAEKFTSDESGLCATFLARHYDGDKLMTPLDGGMPTGGCPQSLFVQKNGGLRRMGPEESSDWRPRSLDSPVDPPSETDSNSAL